MLKQLITHTDERGFFREVLRHTDDIFLDALFAQLSHSYKREGYYTEEFHYHRFQTDYWYVPVGVMRVVLCRLDFRLDDGIEVVRRVGEYEEIITTGEELIKIPPMIAHGLKVLEGPTHLFYITDKIYNPKDEGRIELDYDYSK